MHGQQNIKIWFFIVDSYKYVKNTKGMRCCIYMAKQVRERALILRYAHIVCFVTVFIIFILANFV